VSKKSEHVAKLLQKIELRWSPPSAPLDGANLLTQGLYAVLRRRLDAKTATRSIELLSKAYTDFNELRVAQSQEIASVLKIGQQGIAVAGDARAYLQEVFQRSHGLDLEFLRNDTEAIKRFTATLPFIGMGLAHYLLWLANQGELPVTTAMGRVLDRMGLAPRTSNAKKARAAISPLVSAGGELDFAVRIGEVASRWCDAKKPLCHECVVVDDCKYGKKAFREWRVQQERLEVQRVREEARLAVLRKKEDARRAREEVRERKKAELEAQKRARDAERRAKSDVRKKAAEDKRLAAVRQREDAKKQRDLERQRKVAEAEAARKARKAEALRAVAERKAKAEAARKADAARKAAEKKAAQKKAAAKKKPAAKPAPKKRPAGKAKSRKS
jgi:endonuclease III